MTPAQLAKLIRAHMSLHEQIGLAQLSDDVGADPADVAATLGEMPEFKLGERTGTVTHRKVEGMS